MRFCNTSNSLINNLQLKRFKGMSIKNVKTKSNEFLNCMFGVIEKDMEMVDDCPPECYEQQYYCKVDYLSLACATDGTINFPL